MNELKQTQLNARWLSYGSILLAFLGGATYWWMPMGIVLSLAGLILGLIDWNTARRHSVDFRLAVLGILLCALALLFNAFIAYHGWQTVTFGQG